jgi:quercetin dioxygenase-like cupin family protein
MVRPDAASHHREVTFESGYSLTREDSLEELDMGGGSILWLKVTAAQSRGLVTVLQGVVHEGGPPLHVHEAEDEVVVVLEGELDYRVGEERGTLTPGGLLWFPRQVPHAVANLSEAPCRFLTVVTPSGIEDFFRAQRDYLAGLPAGAAPDPAALAALPGAARRRVVGPPLTRD